MTDLLKLAEHVAEWGHMLEKKDIDKITTALREAHEQLAQANAEIYTLNERNRDLDQFEKTIEQLRADVEVQENIAVNFGIRNVEYGETIEQLRAELEAAKEVIRNWPHDSECPMKRLGQSFASLCEGVDDDEIDCTCDCYKYQALAALEKQ